MMNILDIPDEMIGSLSSNQKRTLCQDLNVIPLKVLVALMEVANGRRSNSYKQEN